MTIVTLAIRNQDLNSNSGQRCVVQPKQNSTATAEKKTVEVFPLFASLAPQRPPNLLALGF